MQVFIVIFTLLSTAFIHFSMNAWNIDQKSFKEKCHMPAPEWMRKLIAEELKPFELKGISEAMIIKTLEKVTQAQGGEISSLVRIKLSQGNIEWETPQTLKEIPKARFEIFLNALEELLHLEPLPDLDILVSFADQYDRPLFLRFTYAPVLTASKDRSNHRSVLIPNGLWAAERESTFLKVLKASEEISWEERIPQAFWRGSLSEGFYHYFDWDFNPRPQLVFFSRHYPDLLDAGFVENQHFKLMHYTWQKWMRENNCIRPYTLPEEQVLYKYLVAIDGAAAPGSIQWQLFSGSTLLKANSNQMEWFYSGLEPYVHYVPFREDSADLGDKILWLQEYPDQAQSIANNAQQFALEHLSDEMIFLYTYKLLQAYAKLLK